MSLWTNDKDSKHLQQLLYKYPAFFNKNDESNLNRYLKVLNSELVKYYWNEEKIHYSTYLNRPLQIQRDASDGLTEIKYYISAYLPNIRKFRITVENKIYLDVDFDITGINEVHYEINEFNNEQKENSEYELPYVSYDTLYFKNSDGFVIKDESLNFEDYPYVSVTQNNILTFKMGNVLNPLILVEVLTYDDLYLAKGYPENDTLVGNEYDHDINLDILGALYNVPRLNHISTDDLQHTVPPYFVKYELDNDGNWIQKENYTEDDYYYMNRIRYYLENLKTEALPLLDLYKSFNVRSSLVNRKDKLERMYVEHNTPLQPRIPKFMHTKRYYNPSTYDVSVDYEDFPSNLRKPDNKAVNSMFTNNMPITAYVFLNSVYSRAKNNVNFKPVFNYKVGEHIIYSNKIFTSLNLAIESVTIDSDNEDVILTVNEDEESQNYFFIITNDGNMYGLEDERVGSKWRGYNLLTDENYDLYLTDIVSLSLAINTVKIDSDNEQVIITVNEDEESPNYFFDITNTGEMIGVEAGSAVRGNSLIIDEYYNLYIQN